MTKLNLVHIGTFGPPLGLGGEIKVLNYTSSVMFFKNLKDYVNEENTIVWKFKKICSQKNYLIVHPIDCNNRADVAELRGRKIFTYSNNFPKIKKNEYYIKDLIGCNIFLNNGKMLGISVGYNNFGAGDLLEIKIKNKTIYIPMDKENLTSVDLNKKQIIISPIKGILN